MTDNFTVQTDSC